MFTLKWTPVAAAEYEELRRKAQNALTTRGKKGQAKWSTAVGLFKQVHNMLVMLGDNPQQPDVVSHEYQSIDNPFGTPQKVFETYPQGKTPGTYRIFWCYGPGKKEITIIAITPHP